MEPFLAGASTRLVWFMHFPASAKETLSIGPHVFHHPRVMLAMAVHSMAVHSMAVHSMAVRPSGRFVPSSFRRWENEAAQESALLAHQSLLHHLLVAINQSISHNVLTRHIPIVSIRGCSVSSSSSTPLQGTHARTHSSKQP